MCGSRDVATGTREVLLVGNFRLKFVAWLNERCLAGQGGEDRATEWQKTLLKWALGGIVCLTTPSVEWYHYYWINWKECTGKWSWDNVRYDPSISVGHLTKTTKNLGEWRQCRELISNRTLSVFRTWPSAKCFRGQIEMGNTWSQIDLHWGRDINGGRYHDDVQCSEADWSTAREGRSHAALGRTLRRLSPTSPVIISVTASRALPFLFSCRPIIHGVHPSRSVCRNEVITQKSNSKSCLR